MTLRAAKFWEPPSLPPHCGSLDGTHLGQVVLVAAGQKTTVGQMPVARRPRSQSAPCCWQETVLRFFVSPVGAVSAPGCVIRATMAHSGAYVRLP